MAGKKAAGIPAAEVDRLSNEFIKTLMRHDMVKAKLMALAISKMPRNGFKVFRVIAQQIVRGNWEFNRMIQEVFSSRYWNMDVNIIRILLFDKFIQLLKFLTDRGSIPVKKILTFNTLNTYFLVGSSENFKYAFESGFIHFGKNFELKRSSSSGIVSTLAERNLYFIKSSSNVYNDLIEKFGLNPNYFIDQSRLYMSRMDNLIQNLLYLIDVFKEKNGKVCNQILGYLLDEFTAIEDYAALHNPKRNTSYPMTDLHILVGLKTGEIDYLDKNVTFLSLKSQSKEIREIIPQVLSVINLYNPSDAEEVKDIEIFKPGSINIYRENAVTS